MIVKNEEKIIDRCLNSVKDIIDYYVIVDTGSTDSTIEKIKSSLKNIPGEIIIKPWINFAVNRTTALNSAKDKADYAILLDADMIVEITDFDKSKLSADAYYLRYRGNLDYCQLLLINNRLEWQYKGVTHEYLSGSFNNFEELKSIKINHLYDGANRQDKFERDIKLLLKGIEDEPNNKRYYFYLANSYKDVGNYDKAIEYYLKRAKMYGWEEEVFYSIYQLGYCSEKLGRIKEAKHYYLQAWEYRPTRAESLCALANLCRQQKEYNQAYIFSKQGLEISYPKDLLFIDKSVYDYLLLFENSIAAYWVKKYQESYDACKQLMSLSNVPESIKQQNRINIRYSEQLLFGRVNTASFDKEEAYKVLEEVTKLFRENNIDSFLMAGTLLGMMRQNDFLAHDSDIDIGITNDDNAEKLSKILVAHGFTFACKFGKQGKNLEYRFFKNGIQIDIFFYYKDVDKLYCGVFDNKGNCYKYLFDFFRTRPAWFKDILVSIPNFPELFLATQYGKDWRIENTNWHYLDAYNKILLRE